MERTPREMAVIKDLGVVLREYPAGESNKKLVLLTQRQGKITVFARGSRRAQSKLATGLFSYNEFVIFDGGGFCSLNHVLPMHIFGGITEDYDKFCLGCCFLEIADKMVLSTMDASGILRILLNTFAEMERDRHVLKLIFAVFVMKVLQAEGLAPLVDDNCAQSGESALRLTPETARALTYILEADGKDIFAFKASDDVANQLYRAARLFVAESLDVQIKSLEMIGDIL